MGTRPFDIARTRVTLFQALLRARELKGGKFKIDKGKGKFKGTILREGGQKTKG